MNSRCRFVYFMNQERAAFVDAVGTEIWFVVQFICKNYYLWKVDVKICMEENIRKIFARFSEMCTSLPDVFMLTKRGEGIRKMYLMCDGG